MEIIIAIYLQKISICKKIINFFHNLKIKNKKILILSKNQLNNRFRKEENLTKYLKHKAQYNIINYKNNSFNYEGVVFYMIFMMHLMKHSKILVIFMNGLNLQQNCKSI